MKLSKKASKAIGCLWLILNTLLLILQTIFLTMKLAGSVSWSWWATLSPTFCMFGLPIAIIVIAVIILMPKLLVNNYKITKAVDREAEKYGMARKPGESNVELKKRIVRRNMVAGNHSRKQIKDILMEAFPSLASVQFEVDHQNNVIQLLVRKMPSNDDGWKAEQFTDEELREIANEAAQYIPAYCTVTIKQAKEEKT